MSKSFIKFHDVAFRYDTASEALFQKITIHMTSGWSGVVGANGTSKTPLLKLAIGVLEPDEGHIDMPPHTIYCPQRTDNAPPRFSKT